MSERSLWTGPIQEAKERRYERTVLEIGCGESFAPWLQKRNLATYRDVHIIRTDVSDKGFARSSQLTGRQIQRAGTHFHGKVEYRLITGARLPTEDRSVDEVYIANVFGDPHLECQAQQNVQAELLKETFRVLKQGGELIIVEWVTPQYGLKTVRLVDSYETWKSALDQYAQGVERYGLRVKAKELPEYQQSADQLDDAQIDAYLSRFPYGQKMVGRLMVPRSPLDHPFTLVFEKI